MQLQEVYLVFILGTLILSFFAFFLILSFIYFKKNLHKHIAEKMNIQHRFQQELLKTRLEVQEQSFRYISEEIHDNVGATLSLCKIQMHELSAMDKDNRIQELLHQNTELLSNAIADLRNISHTLNSSFVERAGLLEALQKEIHYIGSAKKILVELIVNGEVVILSKERELLVFRIIQEAVSNAIRHASPTSVIIFIHYRPKELWITVNDDGCGFVESSSQQGIGLTNMYNRATILEGSLSINSSPGNGTSVKLQINI